MSRITRNSIISIGVLLISYFSFSLPGFVESLSTEVQFRPSALQFSIEPLLFGGVVYLMVICASASFSPIQVEEIQSKFIFGKLIRSSWREYAFFNIGKAIMSGAIVLGGSFLLHSLIFNLIAEPYNVMQFPYHELPFPNTSYNYTLQHIRNALPVYLFMGACHGFFGAAWSLIALCLSVWFVDQLLAISIPLCISWVWIRFPARHLGLPMLRPSALIYEDLDFHWLMLGLIMYSIICIIAIVVYLLGLKKRVLNV